MQNIILSNRSGEAIKNQLAGGENVFAKNFPSGEIYVQLPEDVREKDVHLICSFHRPDLYHMKRKIANSDLDEETKQNLLADYIHSTEIDFREVEKICDACERAGARSVSLYITHFPDSRQDKKDESRVAVSAKLNLDRLASSPLVKRMVTFDLHAPQIQGMVNLPVEHIECGELFVNHVKQKKGLEKSVLILPDAGSYKRYGQIIKDYGMNYAFISKRRTAHNRASADDFVGDSLDGKTAVIFDDMIDTGGTIINACKEAKEAGASEVVAYTTHGLFSTKIKDNEISFAEDKFSEAGIKVYCSDSIPRTKEYREENSDWLEQFSLCPMISDLIEGKDVTFEDPGRFFIY